jgi:hypothetical protein
MAVASEGVQRSFFHHGALDLETRFIRCFRGFSGSVFQIDRIGKISSTTEVFIKFILTTT